MIHEQTGGLVGGDSVVRQVDGETLGGQATPDRGRQPPFVLHDEHPHGPEATCPPGPARQRMTRRAHSLRTGSVLHDGHDGAIMGAWPRRMIQVGG